MNKDELTRIVEIVQKDKEQFELLYTNVISKVYYWCYNMVYNKTTAQDLAQESMIRVYQKLHLLDNASAFYPWLYVLVRNVCYNHLRASKKTAIQFLEFEGYVEGFENTIVEETVDRLPKEAYHVKETKKLIIQFMEELPRKQKEIIMLFYLEGFTYTEIAEMLGYNMGTVRSSLHYGRKNLEKKIKDYQEEHQVSLQSSMLLPGLTLLLLEYSKGVESQHHLSFDKQVYEKLGISKYSSFKQYVGHHILSILLPISMVMIMVWMIADTNEVTSEHWLQLQTVDVEMLEKVTGNPYIENITYGTFPTRDSTVISVYLKKEVVEEQIQIYLDTEVVPFDKREQELIIQAYKNGEYSIVIKDTKFSFSIDTIQPYAPEMTSIQNFEEYIQLYINDELSQMNYEKSYLLFENRRYSITTNNQVQGYFQGTVVVYIFNDDNQYIYYEITLS